MLTTINEVEGVEKDQHGDDAGLPALPSLSFSFKTQEYSTMKKVLIPINTSDCCEGKFQSLDDALQFICLHCLKYYNTTKRNIVHKYAEFVGVIDVVRGAYVPVSSVPVKEFNRVYNHVTKRLINKPQK